jgi:hypothetical protein
VVLLVPVTDEERDVPVWRVERDGDHCPVIHGDAPETAGGALHAERREVEEAPDLVLDLEVVGPVPARWYGAVGAEDAVLPAVLAVLDPIPVSSRKFRPRVDFHHTEHIDTVCKIKTC